jgi:hypothetical protein
MAVAKRKQTLVNSARKNAGRRKLSPAQIKAGFGGKRRQSAMKTHRKRKAKAHRAPKRRAVARHHRPRTKPKATKANRSRRRRRSKPVARRRNVGKVLSFELPKDMQMAKANRSRKRRKSTSGRRRKTTVNRRHHRTRRNPGLGDLTGLVTGAVFTIAGAVGAKYLTQLALNTSNTGIMGYAGNLVAAFALSWATKAFMKNDKAAAAVLAGGIVQLVLRLINDFTPYGSYVSQLGMGDYSAAGLGAYQSQWNYTPQTLAPPYSPYSSALRIPNGGAGLSGCMDLWGGGGLYNAA